jgi:hypothetical protein
MGSFVHAFWRRPRWILASAVVATLTAVAAKQLGLLGTTSASEKLYEAVREGQRAFRQMRFAPLASLDTSDAISELLKKSELIVDPGVSREQIQSLADEAGVFLRLRFIENDPNAYRDWRFSKGCKFSSLENLERHHQIVKIYSQVFDRPAPIPPTVEALFRDYWGKTQSMYGGTNSLRGIADERRGLAMRIGYSTDRDYPRLALNPELGNRIWHGPVSSSMRRWFDLPVPPEELVRRNGKVLCGEVGMISEWGDGTRRPMSLAFYYDPSGQQWILWLMNQDNYDIRTTRVTALEY